MNRIPLAMHPCEECNDTGILVENNAVIRCDACERYPDDLRAAIAFLEANAGWSLDEIKIKPTLE